MGIKLIYQRVGSDSTESNEGMQQILSVTATERMLNDNASSGLFADRNHPCDNVTMSEFK